MSTHDVLLHIVAGGCLFAIIACIVFGVVRGVRRRRREKEALRGRVENAIVKIMADGKIEGPKDRFHPKNWARKWVRYANALPVSRQRYEMGCRELPQFPQEDE